MPPDFSQELIVHSQEGGGATLNPAGKMCCVLNGNSQSGDAVRFRDQFLADRDHLTGGSNESLTCPASQYVGNPGYLVEKHCAAQQVQPAVLDRSDHTLNRLRLYPNAFLPPVIEWPIDAATIQVDQRCQSANPKTKYVSPFPPTRRRLP